MAEVLGSNPSEPIGIVRNEGIIMRLLILISFAIFLLFPISLIFAEEDPLLWKYNLEVDVSDVAISSQGDYIVAGTMDKYVNFFNESGNLIWKYQVGSSVLGVDISSEGDYIVAGDDFSVYLLNYNGTNETFLWERYIGYEVNDIAISSDGNSIVAGFSDGRVQLLNKSNALLWEYGVGNPVQMVDISSDSDYIVAGSIDGNIHFLNKSGDLKWKYDTEISVQSGGISPQGDYIVAGSYPTVQVLTENGTLFYQYTTWKDVAKVTTFADRIYTLVGYKDNEMRLYDGKDKIWDYEISGGVLGLDISNNGDYFAVGSDDNHVYFFSIPYSIQPSINVTSPINKTVSGIVLINATIDDPLVNVTVLIDGKYASSELPVEWDTSATPEGSHTITINAINSRGITSTIDFTVTVVKPEGEEQIIEIVEKEGASLSEIIKKKIKGIYYFITKSHRRTFVVGIIIGIVIGVIVEKWRERREIYGEIERPRYKWEE